MARKKQPPKKMAAAKKLTQPAAAMPAINCVTAERAQQVMDQCMTTFGVSAVSKSFKISATLPGRENAFCACIRTNSGVTQACCDGGMTFQEVEIQLVCP